MSGFGGFLAPVEELSTLGGTVAMLEVVFFEEIGLASGRSETGVVLDLGTEVDPVAFVVVLDVPEVEFNIFFCRPYRWRF